MIVYFLAFLRGVSLLAVTTVPYRVKSVVTNRGLRTRIRLILALYYRPMSYEYLFSLFAFYYSLVYNIARSSSPIASRIYLLSAALIGLEYFVPSADLAGFLLFIIAYILDRTGDYNLKRLEIEIGDISKAKEIDEHDESVVSVRPLRKARLYRLTESFIRLYNVAYEPPNGLLVSLGAIVFSLLPRLI